MIGKEKKDLNDFSLSQLQILLKHLRLGFDHLKLVLTAKQMNELLGWCRLSQEQEEQMSAGRVELLGNMSLFINTILQVRLELGWDFRLASDAALVPSKC